MGEVQRRLPVIDFDAVDFDPGDVVPAAEAWGHLEQFHHDLLAHAERLASSRGSGEWLWWLRRLRGQFHLNARTTTEPYLQGLAEALFCGTQRPSTPLSGSRLNFAGTERQIRLASPDLLMARSWAAHLYILNSTMMRCAKGQGVVFYDDGTLPEAVEDAAMDEAICAYDDRNELARRNDLHALGLQFIEVDSVDPDAATFLGQVLIWSQVSSPGGDPLDAEPPPTGLSWLHLDDIDALREAPVIDETHVALLLLLEACLYIANHDPHKFRQRMTAAWQFGYMVVHPENLDFALDVLVQHLHTERSPAVPETAVPESGPAVLEVLKALRPSIRPVLPGCPIHEAGSQLIVDLIGTSRRLLDTLTRPQDGSGANLFSNRFEQDVQSLIDATPWSPDAATRPLVGRVVRRRDGSHITDIDAVAVNGNDVLLVSCKSIAATGSHRAGGFAAMRNVREKTEKAIEDWDRVLGELHTDPDLLRVPLPGRVQVHGVVVLPETPWVSDPDHYRPREFLGLPPAISTDELRRSLAASEHPTPTV